MLDPDYERAQRARVPYLEPRSVHDPDGRRDRVATATSLQSSYDTQVHVTSHRGVRTLLRPVTPLPGVVPGAGAPVTGWLLTAWNPLGRPATLAENHEATAALCRAVAAAGGRAVAIVTTVPPDLSWVEDTVHVRGLAPATVRALARRFGQPAVSALGRGTLTVWPTELGDAVHLATWRTGRAPWSAGCPMRVDGERCVMRGGPWTSGSITAASIWSRHRSLLLGRLGCRVCADGEQPVGGPGGRVVDVAEHVLASRYGGYAWR